MINFRAATGVCLLMLLNACSDSTFNSPHPAEVDDRTTYYSSFTLPPKHLDPALSYATDESVIIDQIYESPLGYHFLKRPYELEPLAAEAMPLVTYLGEDGEPSEMAKQGFKTPEQGCSTTLWAATSESLSGVAGVYCEDCDIASPTDTDSPLARYRGVDPHACNDDDAERLWSLSEQLLSDA